MPSLRSKDAPRGHARLVDELRTATYPVPTAEGWNALPSLQTPAERRREALADAAYIVLTTTGWLAGNLLGVLGCAVVMFIVISHGHIDTFFLHLDNLASRYVSADLDRRAVFGHQLIQVFAIVVAGTLLIRGPRFVARLRRELREGAAS